MLTNWITKIDFIILNWIGDNLSCEPLDKILLAVTFLGEKGWFFIVIAVVLLCMPKTRRWGASLAVSLSLGLVFCNMLIKNMVARVRPYDQVEHILLVDKLSDYSFPSGHTTAAFECFAVILMMPVKKIYKVMAGILAFLIAFSRLYLYVHFPSDVLAGMLIGFLFGVMGVRIVEMILEEKNVQA
ncbi:MAG: phosphatase PAP2 family protein [Lachnospiraceae bacterium]|nr:phosphatase PAP2 family protein [Lachnospiraceae bacterium]